MAIPSFEELMLPLLKYGNEGETSFKEAVEKASDDFELTVEERERLTPSRLNPLIKDRTSWAITYLVKANLLQRPKRARFTITDRGKEILAKNPDGINKKYLEQFPEFVEFLNKRNEKKVSTTDDPDGYQDGSGLVTPEERIGEAYDEISSEVKSELLAQVLSSTPAFFERLIVKLLVAMGYGGSVQQAGTHLGRSGDGGVDGVIDEDKLGLDSIYIQAKRYEPGNTIGRPDIQKFAGSLIGMGAHKGVFVSTSSFSKEAVAYADKVQHRIILIDGEKLTSLMLEHNVGVRVNQTIELKRIDEDFFLDT